jgi:hypothetical protein
MIILNINFNIYKDYPRLGEYSNLKELEFVVVSYATPISDTQLSTAYVGAVKGAAEDNFGAVKGQKRAVILKKSSREGSAGPGNPGAEVRESPPWAGR